MQNWFLQNNTSIASVVDTLVDLNMSKDLTGRVEPGVI